MITDVILGWFVTGFGFIVGVFPRIPLGPFAANGVAWVKLTQVAAQMGGLAAFFPLAGFSVAATTMATAVPVAVAITLVRRIVSLIRGGGG